MKKNYILLFCISSCFSFAQIPAGYYNSASGLTGASLKTALHNIIYPHTSITYAQLWTAFDSTDTRTNKQIWDIYSDVPGSTPPYVFYDVAAGNPDTLGRCGNYNSEGDCYNREHSWPESWFNGVTGPYTDLFHIYPTDGWVNNKRADYPYGEVSTPIYTSLNGGKLGNNTTVGYSSTVFEPIDEYKGDLARGYFYMTTCYMNKDSAWSSSDATNKSTIEPWAVCLFLKWHHQDLVSTKEIDRNNAIYKIQQNRNPFIDHPEWADSVFSCTLNSIKTILKPKVEFTLFPNPGNENVTILFSKNISTGVITLHNSLGEKIISQTIQNSNGLQLNTSNLAKGVYIVSINLGDYSVQKKLLVE